MWIVVSVPFWIVGALCVGAVCLALFQLATDKNAAGDTDPSHVFVGLILILVLAGVFFYIAAKIVGS